MFALNLSPLIMGASTLSRPGRSHFDPAFQSGDLLVLELAFGRHLQVARLADRQDQQALFGVSGHDRRPRVAAP